MVQNQESLRTPARLSLELRKFESTDYDRYSEIRSSLFPDQQLSAQELRTFDDSLDRTRYHIQRYTCLNKETGEIVGFGDIGHIPWMFNPRRFLERIWVDQKHQKKGVGQFIYEKLTKDATELHALEAWGFAREDMPLSVAFLSKRDFKERFRTWESWLNPAEVDLQEFQRYRDGVARAGVEISFLTQERESDPDCYRKLYELNQTLMSDVPMPEPYTPVPYEQWLSFDMKDHGLLPEAYAIAKDGAEYIGLCTVRRLDKEPHSLHQLLTGVRKDHRGKGVAYAMKLKVIEYSQKNGIQRIKTENATTNAPMLAINMKLGFKRQVGWIAFSKTLTVSVRPGTRYHLPLPNPLPVNEPKIVTSTPRDTRSSFLESRN